jgi:hypothetical protein
MLTCGSGILAAMEIRDPRGQAGFSFAGNLDKDIPGRMPVEK